MRRVLITSQKGGVGKTTTAVNLAALAASGGRKVLLLDTDTIGGVEAGLNLSPSAAVALETGEHGVRGRLHEGVAPGLDVLALDSEGSFSRSPGERVAGLLAGAPLGREYQVVVIDSPPLKSASDFGILGECDEVLLVQRAEPLSLQTLPPLLAAIREQEQGERLRFHGVVLSLAAGSDGAEEAPFREALGESLRAETLPHDPDVERALLVGKPVVSAGSKGPAAAQFRALGSRLGLRESDEAKPAAPAKTAEPPVAPEAAAPVAPSKSVKRKPPAAAPKKAASDHRAEAWEALEGSFPEAEKLDVPAPAVSAPESGAYTWVVWVLLAVIAGVIVGVASKFLPR